MSSTKALSYEEPGIVTILVLASFLLSLNAINYAFDRILYCGLIGQVLVGVAWGTPGANWLSQDVQNSVMQIGYLGLILIVYEGGLSTKLRTLQANLALSATVAFVGISTPIALSFILLKMLPTTPLQAFAAGAALCSTSLGTTFTVLQTSGLTESRLGVILASAAMMDDVVGLIMVQVISNLGNDSPFQAATVVRPIGVSLAFATIIPSICMWVVRPIAQISMRKEKHNKLHARIAYPEAALVFHTAVLLALVTGSTYAGTSNLFAAYLAGASVTWLDNILQDCSNNGLRSTSTRPNPEEQRTAELSSANTASPLAITLSDTPRRPAAPTDASDKITKDRKGTLTGAAVYEKCYAPAVKTILKPFFFASIGFSTPIEQMLSGSAVWRGFIYTALMVLGKMACGLCLVRFGLPSFPQPWKTIMTQKNKRKTASQSERGIASSEASQGQVGVNEANTAKKRSNSLSKPRSLYPAAILGSAMVSRGEIGFLISSVAQSRGIYTIGESSSELFIVLTWAILLCTVLGPVTVGLLVKRVKRLQLLDRQKRTGKEDPLGIWGVVGT